MVILSIKVTRRPVGTSAVPWGNTLPTESASVPVPGVFWLPAARLAGSLTPRTFPGKYQP
jgi:hypothetical protein